MAATRVGIGIELAEEGGEGGATTTNPNPNPNRGRGLSLARLECGQRQSRCSGALPLAAPAPLRIELWLLDYFPEKTRTAAASCVFLYLLYVPAVIFGAPPPLTNDCGASERVWETGWRAGSCVRRCLLLLCLDLLTPYLGFVVVRVLRSPASRPAQRRLSGAAACAAAAPLRCVAFTSPTTSDTQAAHPESTLAPGVMVPRSRR